MADLEAISSPPSASLASVNRRTGRREEWTEQTRFATLLTKHVDPSCAWFTGIENKPHSRISGMLQRRRGCRSGVPDFILLWRHARGTRAVFIEMKSRRGQISRVQNEMRLELMKAGAKWYAVRTARAAMMALYLEGVPLRRKWKPPRRLRTWEGPAAEPRNLPFPPEVIAERREQVRLHRRRKSRLHGLRHGPCRDAPHWRCGAGRAHQVCH
jgi:hypothetical protein